MVLAQLYKPPGDLRELLVQGVLWSPELLDDVLHSRWLELIETNKREQESSQFYVRRQHIIYHYTKFDHGGQAVRTMYRSHTSSPSSSPLGHIHAFPHFRCLCLAELTIVRDKPSPSNKEQVQLKQSSNTQPNSSNQKTEDKQASIAQRTDCIQYY